MKSSRHGRRTVLRRMAAGGIGFNTIVGSTAAARGRGKHDYVGVVYDPVSAEILSPAEGRLDEGDHGIEGTLSLPPKAGPAEIPFTSSPQDRAKTGDVTERLDGDVVTGYGSTVTGDDGRFARGHHPMRVKMTSLDGRELSGTAKHSGFDQVAFLMRRSTPGKTGTEVRDEVAAIVRGDSR